MKSKNPSVSKYLQYSSRLKEITRWQAIRLKEKGYTNISISKILGIHASTVSSWHKNFLKTTPISAFDTEATLDNKFGKLQADELKIITHLAIQLVDEGVKRSKVADILGLSSGAVISGWLNAKKQKNKLINAKKCKASTPIHQNKKTYKKITNKMKKIIQWQILRLKHRGYDDSYISNILNIKKSDFSKHFKLDLKSDKNSPLYLNDTLTERFGTLSVSEKKILLYQIASLERNGFQRSDIAKLIGISSGAVISGWQKKKSSSDHKENKKKEEKNTQYETVYQNLKLLKFHEYKTETKNLVKWQAIFLKKNGHKYSEISDILNIHASTVSRWWKAYLQSGEKPEISHKSKINNHFKKLTPEMKRVISFQILNLKYKNHTHEEIAKILALNNGALISRWLINISQFTETRFKKHVKTTPILLPEIGLKNGRNSPQNKTSIKGKENTPVRSEKIKVLGNDHSNSHSPSEPLSVQSVNKKTDNPVCFLKNKQTNTVELKSQAKIIKAGEYFKYINADKLLKASKINLLKSKKKAEKITKKAEKSAEIITKNIIKRAEKKALKKAEDLVAEKYIAAASSATNYLKSLQEDLPDLILSIINKFIENYDDKDFIIQTINSAISEISNKEKIKIYVNSKVLNDVKKRLHQIKYPDEKITLISDTSLGKKDCLVVTKLGVVNANLESQIKKIEERICATSAF